MFTKIDWQDVIPANGAGSSSQLVSGSMRTAAKKLIPPEPQKVKNWSSSGFRFFSPKNFRRRCFFDKWPIRKIKDKFSTFWKKIAEKEDFSAKTGWRTAERTEREWESVCVVVTKSACVHVQVCVCANMGECACIGERERKRKNAAGLLRGIIPN